MGDMLRRVAQSCRCVVVAAFRRHPMTAEHVSGPSIIYGTPNSSASITGGSNPEAGPSVTYQGDCILDPRFPYQPGVTGVGKVNCWLDTPYILMVDAVPSTLQTACIASLATVSTNAAMTLATTQIGLLTTSQIGNVSVSVPLVPFGSASVSGNVVKVLAIDLGYSGGISVTSGGTTFTTTSNTAPLSVGQKLLVAAGVTPQVVTITGISGTTVTVDTPFNATNTQAAIATMDANGNSVSPFISAGAARPWDPQQAISRCVCISGSTSGTGGAFVVKGYDVFGVPVSETITVGAGQNTVSGKKAFKYIASVTPQFGDAHNYAVGTTDVFGINTRSDKWEYTNFYWAGAFITSSTGWTASVSSTATATTGDVRGTYNVQSASNGTNRLAMFTSIPLAALVTATPSNTAPLFGVTQYTA